MSIRILPSFLVNQIAAGEVVERPASVVKELCENALDAGANDIVIDVLDGGRTMISITDNGCGMSADDLARSVMRHATSKLPDDNLHNINFMGFRGEALPSIASVSEMTIETRAEQNETGFELDATSGEIKPSAWENGTRVRVRNLFRNVPARLKFLRSDRAELMAIVDTVKRLALSRPDVGFTLNNRWRFPRGQDLLERVIAVLGDDARGRMLAIGANTVCPSDSCECNSPIQLAGYMSEPTLRRASSVDQYLFVNGRAVRDKVLIGALRAAYMDVMHAREFPLAVLYLTLPARDVDVNVSPAKTDVHFLEPAHVRALIIKRIREALAIPMNTGAASIRFDDTPGEVYNCADVAPVRPDPATPPLSLFRVAAPDIFYKTDQSPDNFCDEKISVRTQEPEYSLGRALFQIAKKYIVAVRRDALIVVDQHAAAERITYERLRTHKIKRQPLLSPIVTQMRAEDVMAVLSIADELDAAGLKIDAFGDDAIAIYEKPADWDLDWGGLFHDIADEARAVGHSSRLAEKLHLKLANFACHHSVRAGQALSQIEMDALLRDIENTERGAECNHGRPVYKIIPISELDKWFERV